MRDAIQGTRKNSVKTGRILLVDDEPGLTTLFRMMLENEGHVVRTINEGCGVVQAVREFKPDLVLLDLNMPGTSGAEIARFISQDPTIAETRILFLSGEDI